MLCFFNPVQIDELLEVDASLMIDHLRQIFGVCVQQIRHCFKAEFGIKVQFICFEQLFKLIVQFYFVDAA